jgi:hypothetical protein
MEVTGVNKIFNIASAMLLLVGILSYVLIINFEKRDYHLLKKIIRLKK